MLNQRDTVNRFVEFRAPHIRFQLFRVLKKPHTETLGATLETAARLQRTAERLKPDGLRVAFHNHWMEFDHSFDGRTPYRVILDEAPDVGSELDTYWAAVGGADVTAIVRQDRSRLPLLHVKDGPIDPRSAAHVALGTGRMDWPAVMAGVDPQTTQWLIVELDKCDTDMMTAVRQSAEFLIESGYGKGRA